MALRYDLLLKGGRVIDLAQGIDGPRDVAFHDGLVAALAPDLPAAESREVVDVSGKLVTPGLLDIHGHFFYLGHPMWAEPIAANLPFGVTTAVDGGSTGWANFPALRHYVMDRCPVRLFAFLHLSATGLDTLAAGVGELLDFRMARAQETAQCLKENRDLLLGIKVRLAPNGTGAENAHPSLEMARRVAQETGTLLMVHVSGTPLTLKEVFTFLKPGDIVTHIYNGRENNILDDRGKVRPEVEEAARRGIVLDTACARVHFDLDVCRAAIQQKLWPHTLSTDRGRNSYTLLDVMTIFLELGLPLEEVIAAVTSRAAAAIGKAAERGTLRVGMAGDAAVLELESGNFSYDDSSGKVVRCQRRFACALTVKDGRRWRPAYP